MRHNSEEHHLVSMSSSRGAVGPEAIPQPEPSDRLRPSKSTTDEEKEKHSAPGSQGAGEPKAWTQSERPDRLRHPEDEDSTPAIAPGSWGTDSADAIPTPVLADHPQRRGKLKEGRTKVKTPIPLRTSRE